MSFVRNILKIYRQATAEEIQHGMTWYSDAQSACQDIADQCELPLRVVVGVTAALSPTNDWGQNVKDADLFCSTFASGGYFEDVKASTYKTMWEKAWRILKDVPASDDDVRKILNGPKITDFFSCIMGENVCVIDGHAWCIANADRRVLQNVPNIGKKSRLELQQAYVKAAKRMGVTAYQMQAITWVAWRRIHNIG